MTYRYTLRRLDETGDPGPEVSRLVMGRNLTKHIDRTTRPEHRLEYDGVLHIPLEKTQDVVKRVKAAFARDDELERIIVDSERGPRWAIKRFEKKQQPLEDTEGTRPIDKIYTAVHNRFDHRWLVRDMGICVDKPGEHGHCNAWDAGTNMDVAATVTWMRIEKMAAWIRSQGLLYQNTNGAEGLPVNGVIVQDYYWEQGMGKFWRPYTGIKHVSHFHVSGSPSITGWI